MQRSYKYGFLFLTVLMLAALVPAAAAQTAFTPGECAFPVPEGASVDCGMVTVPENRVNADSGTIEIAVAVVRSTSETPGAPMVFLQGGPGGGAINLIAQTYPTFVEPLAQDRDLIFVDQRGTGLSMPALACPEVTEASLVDLEAVLDADASGALYLDAFTACRDRLIGEGVDLSAYTSAENAADIVDVAAALGYEQVHLYGGSYGTRLALTVLRDFPERVVSAVLDSAIAVETNLYEEQAFKTDFAFNRLFAACEADAACNAAYPALADQLNSAISALDATPVPLTVVNPLTGASYEVQVTGTDLMSGLFFGLQVPQFIPELPGIIAAAAEGDVSGINPMLTLTLILADTVNIGMFASVNCHEEVFASTPERISAAWDAYPLARDFSLSAAYGSTETLFEVCETWGASAFDPAEVEPVITDLPVLALAGEFDPATPVVWTQQIAEALPNSAYYEFPAQTHVVAVNGGCALEVTRAFFNAPESAAEAAACIETMPQVSFSVPGAAEDNAEIVLVEYVDEEGWSTLVPEGWTLAQAGVWARAETITDPTVLVAGIGSGPTTETVTGVLASLGITDVPAPESTLSTAAADWSVYRVSSPMGEIALAVSQAESDPFLVFLLAATDESEALYSGVFLPAVENFALSQ